MIIDNRLLRQKERFCECNCRFMLPIVICNHIASNLIHPTLEFLFIAESINTGVDFQKDLLQKIFCIVFVWDAFEYELLDSWVKFFPYFFCRHNHRHFSFALLPALSQLYTLGAEGCRSALPERASYV